MVEDGDGSVFIYFWVGEKMKAVAIHVKDSILCLSFYDWIRVTLPRMGFAVGCETILLFVLNIYHPFAKMSATSLPFLFLNMKPKKISHVFKIFTASDTMALFLQKMLLCLSWA